MEHSFLKFQFSDVENKRRKPRTTAEKLLNLFKSNFSSLKFEQHKLELMGVIDMVEGLEYHYKKFQKFEKKYHKSLGPILDINTKLITDIKLPEEMVSFTQYTPAKNMIHEVVAYLNRLGQLNKAFTSAWFKERVSDEQLIALSPIIRALIPFRNKFAAHRSIDCPHKETPEEKRSHASLPWAINMQGKIGETFRVSYTIKIARPELLDRPPVKEVEMFIGKHIWLTFKPTLHHDLICTEILNVIDHFFKYQITTE